MATRTRAAQPRRETVADLRAQGMSTRQIAAAVGVDAKTVRNDLGEVGRKSSPAPAKVTGSDGKSYPATKAAPSTSDKPAAPATKAKRRADGPLEASVRAAVAVHPADPSAVLALTYAAQIDEATHVPADLAEAIAVMHALAVEPAAQRSLRRLVTRIARVTVTGDLGPKLLAALDALALTPKSKGAAKSAEGGTDAGDELAKLRRRRAGRTAG